jgi:hypothetical protein
VRSWCDKLTLCSAMTATSRLLKNPSTWPDFLVFAVVSKDRMSHRPVSGW